MDQKTTELDIRQQEKLQIALSEADYVLTKNYQYDLPNCPVLKPSEEFIKRDITKYTRLFKIDRIAYDKNEDNLAKLSNVYNALSAVGGSVIIIIDSDDEGLDFYIGTKTENEQDIHIAYKTLEKSLLGNFPGCVIKNLKNRKIKETISKAFEYRNENSSEEDRAISSVSGVSNLRNISGNKDKHEFTQGIEKLIDSMMGETYTAVLIADPVPQNQIDVIRKGYEQLYTKLMPFSGAELSVSQTQGDTFTESLTNGISDTVSESLTKSQSHSHTSSHSTSSTSTVGVAFIASASYSTSTTDTESDTYTSGTAETKGESHTDSYSKSLSSAISTGESKSVQIKTEEKSITSLLERIDIQLERLSECGDLGMWNCSAYFIADDVQISKTAASNYQALIRGENSSIEAITINTWSQSEDNQKQQNYEYISEYLHQLCHPEIFIGENLPIVTPTSLVSSAELTIQAGIPQKSISGMAVAHYAAFGREVQSQDECSDSSIYLGNIFHMGIKESKKVLIDSRSLTSHTFITGSTGSGKSNTVYQIISELEKEKIPFLVIEPAKGEYKNIFGNQQNVKVFGTNPKKTQLLKINPFKFPSDVHVLEHIDRLIEIFNVCWPMYAAMPAVLKDAVERAYINVGWDFETSENKNKIPLYPTFEDVLTELHRVIDESDYSLELKGNYAGALVTRVKSLTTGLNGQIFTCNEVNNHELFDSNTIIDLSRVASSETKALIMGILVMRLQEHRMSEGGMNKPLRHITVLEEAHHLLKRTSTEQTSEGSNLLGKSVEMLSQSIAEMRTYGEGFIIADQSPNMLDMSVIRNTNTKIILRLPDMSDRELCGRAANLNDEQLIELAKLPTGVAAVYQNNWIEPVLCKVENFDASESEYTYTPSVVIDSDIKLKESLVRCLLSEFTNKKVEYSIDDMCQRVINSNFSSYTKLTVMDAIKTEHRNISDVCNAVSSLFHTSNMLKDAYCANNVWEWNDRILKSVGYDFNTLGVEYSISVLNCLLKQKSIENPALDDMYRKWIGIMKVGEK